MPKQKKIFYSQILLILGEVVLIGFVGYAAGSYLPRELGRYISLDLLYCLPIIQTARFSAIHASRSYDTQTPIIIGISLAFVWSSIEAAVIWPDFPVIVYILNTFTRSVVLTVIGRVLVKLWRENEYSRKDTLTELANRLELLERLKVEQSRSERSRRPYSLLFMDIDRFKVMNDTHGHQIGDEVLKVLAKILMECSRKVDVAARLGGDEFALLLPDTDEKSCDMMLKRIEESTKKAFEARSWPISVSIGRTTHIGNSQEVDNVIGLADKNMYEVKRMKK